MARLRIAAICSAVADWLIRTNIGHSTRLADSLVPLLGEKKRAEVSLCSHPGRTAGQTLTRLGWSCRVSKVEAVHHAQTLRRRAPWVKKAEFPRKIWSPLRRRRAGNAPRSGAIAQKHAQLHPIRTSFACGGGNRGLCVHLSGPECRFRTKYPPPKGDLPRAGRQYTPLPGISSSQTEGSRVTTRTKSKNHACSYPHCVLVFHKPQQWGGVMTVRGTG